LIYYYIIKHNSITQDKLLRVKFKFLKTLFLIALNSLLDWMERNIPALKWSTLKKIQFILENLKFLMQPYRCKHIKTRSHQLVNLNMILNSESLSGFPKAQFLALYLKIQTRKSVIMFLLKWYQQIIEIIQTWRKPYLSLELHKLFNSSELV